MEIRDRITRILEEWFLQEPALFQVLCSHQLCENTSIHCPVRCGRMRVEYNPLILEEMSPKGLEEALRTEAIRILLKHPYERKPDQCCDEAIAIGSNVTIGDNYRYGSFRIESPADFSLEKGRTYEWYSRQIQEMLPPSDGTSPGGGGDRDKFTELSALWEEDEMALMLINGIIDSVKSWGSLAGSLAEKIKAGRGAGVDWRKILSGFRASIISSRRRLTRMRPSRRYGFESMGSTREFDTKLLVAVDVSGSITSERLSHFYGVIHNAFRYGIDRIDVAQFDCGIRVVHEFRRSDSEVLVVGRGGTSFQEPIDYAVAKGYDGIVILTDGYAPEPTVPQGSKLEIVWVCESQNAYTEHKGWMEKSGRVCYIDL